MAHRENQGQRRLPALSPSRAKRLGHPPPFGVLVEQRTRLGHPPASPPVRVALSGSGKIVEVAYRVKSLAGLPRRGGTRLTENEEALALLKIGGVPVTFQYHTPSNDRLLMLLPGF